jgi:hypothetical protein
MEKFQVPVTFDSANRRKDRSIRMSFSSMFEMNTEDYMEIDQQLQQSGWLVFATKAVNDIDIPDEDFDNDISKSQSTQIRDVLWVLYKARGGKTEDKESWNLFYRKQMQVFKGRILEEVRKIEEESK